MDKYAHLLEKYSSTDIQHIDIISVTEKNYTLALRVESIEEVSDTFSYVVIRVFSKNGWGIIVTSDMKSEGIESALNRAIKLSKKALPAKAYKGIMHLAECEISSGVYKHNEKLPPEKADIGNIIDTLYSIKENALDRLKSRFAWSEEILTYKKQKRHIITSDGIHITEVKPTTDFTFYVVTKSFGRRLLTASGIIGFTSGLEIMNSKKLEEMVGTVLFRAYQLINAGRINPIVSGKQINAVLNYEVAGALIHEAVGHTLEADRLIEKGGYALSIKGSKIANQELEIIDDPTIIGGYGSYFFDDEGVRGRRKILIQDGRVVELLHTRLSAAYFNEPPNGSARGLVHQPRALMSNLYIVPQDWKFEEMLSDMREGLYVEGLMRAELRNDLIIIEPEIAYLVEKGEIKRPIYNLKLAARAEKILMNIDAVGKQFNLRPGLEKGHPISDGGSFIRVRGLHIIS
ncbi:MAG: TldD/PmbA family protein [Candidatus Asgardarchaeia archaeon]